MARLSRKSTQLTVIVILFYYSKLVYGENGTELLID